MKEGLNLEGAKKLLKIKFEKIKRFVDLEIEIQNNGYKIPYVSERCPEKYKDLAERLVLIQTTKGEIKTEDIENSDVNRIKDMTKKTGTGLSFRDNISLMVENAYFVDYDVINARHVLKLIQEFDEIYEKYYAQNGMIPLNAFSTETRLFIKNLKSGLSKEDVVRLILEIYRPDKSGVKMQDHNYDLMPKTRNVLSEEEIKKIVSALGSIADGKNIDAIFSQKYETYFRKLCEKLKLAGYTFESFITKHTDFEYTLCFRADILQAVKQMCLSYYEKNGTTVGIQRKDPYLYTKIDLAKEILGVYSMSDALQMLGIESDNYDTSKYTLSKDQIKDRELALFGTLERLFPDKFIPLRFSLSKNDIYEELLFLARRRKFADVNDYLKSKGFSRDMNYNAKVNRGIFLSERDVQYYGFLHGCKNEDMAEAWLESKGLELADPYVNLGIYRKLAFEKIDSLYHADLEENQSKKQI